MIKPHKIRIIYKKNIEKSLTTSCVYIKANRLINFIFVYLMKNITLLF